MLFTNANVLLEHCGNSKSTKTAILYFYSIIAIIALLCLLIFFYCVLQFIIDLLMFQWFIVYIVAYNIAILQYYYIDITIVLNSKNIIYFTCNMSHIDI
jgi:small-conductance mechanosensitive channel